MTNKLRLPLISIIFAVSAALLSLSAFSNPAAAAGIDQTRDCDDTAIIRCGVMTLEELKTKYAANEYGDLPAIYKAFNIANFDGFVNGEVMRDGKVYVNGKLVATGAMTAARTLPGGDIAGSNANIISPSVWPAEYITGKPAYVKMVDGKFAYAILKTCGNPVKAVPVTPPPTPPAPAAACTTVEAIKKSRDTYEFKATASATNGATISNYSFRIFHTSGTGKIINAATNATSASSGDVKLEIGTHTVKVVVTTSLGEKTGPQCETKVIVPEEDKVVVCNPATGLIITVPKSEESKYKPVNDIACKVKVCNPANGEIITVDKSEEDRFKPVDDIACKPKEEPKVEGVTTIAKTGPTDFLIGGAGLSSLTAAGYYWRASRRRLVSTLLNR